MDAFVARLLDQVFRASRVFTKFVGSQFINQPVPIGVARRLMSASGDFADQVRIAFRHPPEDKESPFDLVIVEQIEDALRVALNTTGVARPSGAVNDAGEGLDMVVILDVDRNNAFANQGSD